MAEIFTAPVMLVRPNDVILTQKINACFIKVQKKKYICKCIYKYVYWLGMCREGLGQGFGYNWSYHKLKTKGMIFPIQTSYYFSEYQLV